ncbi:MAG: PilZ domain-containing protein [Bdellovibrionaceae bacterium]|nr:PilZ domain-containing protein [Pseudobdellovibrionaceae bacterium]
MNNVIVIVSANQVESKKIFETLSEVEASDYRLDFEFLRPTQLPDKLDMKADLIVYNNNTNLNMNMYQQVASWRKKGQLASVLMLSKVADENLIHNVEPMNNMVVLEKPYVESDLKGISQKMLDERKIQQRKYRRFNVAQKVSLSSYKSGFSGESQVCNMSRGGLCIQGGLVGLTAGDLLRIDFNLDKISTHRTVNGKVIWISEYDEQPQAGIEFIKESDVYGHLLDDIG